MSSDRNKKQLLAVLDTARTIALEMVGVAPVDEAVADRLAVEGRKIQQGCMALLLAFISDEPTPISLFKPWASYSQFRIWEGDKTLKLTRRNRKVCVIPSDFFTAWRKLKD